MWLLSLQWLVPLRIAAVLSDYSDHWRISWRAMPRSINGLRIFSRSSQPRMQQRPTHQPRPLLNRHHPTPPRPPTIRHQVQLRRHSSPSTLSPCHDATRNSIAQPQSKFSRQAADLFNEPTIRLAISKQSSHLTYSQSNLLIPTISPYAVHPPVESPSSVIGLDQQTCILLGLTFTLWGRIEITTPQE